MAGAAWKTIESAPKNGRAVLLYARCKTNPDHTFAPIVGFWNKQLTLWKVAPECLNRGEELIPSHWMEIPELPE
jgi:hypothetical protein